MATQTTHYDLVKQQSPERVSVGLLNDNFDIIDDVMFANQEKSEQLADDYNASETYNTGDYVRRENYLYKCNTDNTTGTWDDTKWDRVKVMDEITQGGGGGSSTLAGLNDVNISSPTDGQALVYDNATGKWVNRAGGGGSSTFAGLNDVNVQGVQNGDIARYNSTTGKWTDSSDLTDLELTVAQLQASVLSITDGHTILASDGTAMAQEDGLQFASGYVEDDPVKGKTVYIEMIRISQANYDTLKANGQLKPGAKYFIYDAQPVAVNASNLPYSSTQSTKQKIDEIVDDLGYQIITTTSGTWKVQKIGKHYARCSLLSLKNRAFNNAYGAFYFAVAESIVFPSLGQDTILEVSLQRISTGVGGAIVYNDSSFTINGCNVNVYNGKQETINNDYLLINVSMHIA